jgi:Leucine-rich repeat (LRR) protein
MQENSNKSMRFLLILFLFVSQVGVSQLYSDSAYKKVAVYNDLQDALVDSGSVKKLILKRDKLTIFPMDILKLTELEYLDLSSNKIDSLPTEINQLKNLRVLILTRNSLLKFPKEIFELQYLKVLKIGGNEFETIPRGIDSLKVIEEIDLWNTSINDLPFGIENIKSLKRLDLRGILLNYEKQEEIFELLPNVKVYLSPACNCGF